jgi:hypothetical protein
MTPLETALVELASLLDELGIPYIVIGGLAVALWGEPRSTLDVDLSLWVEPGDIGRIVAALSERVRPLPAEPLSFVTRTRVLPVLTSQGIRADLVLAALPIEREAIDRAKVKYLGGRAVRVASVEDLVFAKLISERAKDREDALRLIHRFGRSLDRTYLEPRLEQMAEALARPDIIQVWRELARAPRQ